MPISQAEVYRATFDQTQAAMNAMLIAKDAIRQIPDSDVGAILMTQWQTLYDEMAIAKEQARVCYLATRNQ